MPSQPSEGPTAIRLKRWGVKSAVKLCTIISAVKFMLICTLQNLILLVHLCFKNNPKCLHVVVSILYNHWLLSTEQAFVWIAAFVCLLKYLLHENCNIHDTLQCNACHIFPNFHHYTIIHDTLSYISTTLWCWSWNFFCNVYLIVVFVCLRCVSCPALLAMHWWGCSN